MTDDQVIKVLEDRTNKVKTASAMEPINTPFKTLGEAWDAFNASRDKLIEYVGNTNDDLRNHVSVLPFATFDDYQMILFIGAHSNRHRGRCGHAPALFHHLGELGHFQNRQLVELIHDALQVRHDSNFLRLIVAFIAGPSRPEAFLG